MFNRRHRSIHELLAMLTTLTLLLFAGNAAANPLFHLSESVPSTITQGSRFDANIICTADTALTAGAVKLEFHSYGGVIQYGSQAFGALAKNQSVTKTFNIDIPPGYSGDLLASVFTVFQGDTLWAARNITVEQSTNPAKLYTVDDFDSNPDLTHKISTTVQALSISAQEIEALDAPIEGFQMLSDGDLVAELDPCDVGDPPTQTMTVHMAGKIEMVYPTYTSADEFRYFGPPTPLPSLRVDVYAKNLTGKYVWIGARYADQDGNWLFTKYGVERNRTNGSNQGVTDVILDVTFRDVGENRIVHYYSSFGIKLSSDVITNVVSAQLKEVSMKLDETTSYDSFELGFAWLGFQNAIALGIESGWNVGATQLIWSNKSQYNPLPAYRDRIYVDRFMSMKTKALTMLRFRKTSAHEYGHRFQHKILGDQYPILVSTTYNHWLWRESPGATVEDKRQFAFVEGFAGFWSVWSQEHFTPNLIHWYRGDYNLEQIPTSAQSSGIKVEGSVATAFKDLVDETTDSDGSYFDGIVVPVSHFINSMSTAQNHFPNKWEDTPTEATILTLADKNTGNFYQADYNCEGYYISEISAMANLFAQWLTLNYDDAVVSAPSWVNSGADVTATVNIGDHWELQDVVYEWRWRRNDPEVGEWQDITSSTSGSYTITMPKNQIRIKCRIESEEEETYNTAGKTVNGIYSTATTPTNLQLTSSVGQNVEIAWDEVLDGCLTGYYVFRSVFDGPYTQLATVPRTQLTFTDSDYITQSSPAGGNAKLEYRVKAYHGDPYAVSGYSNTVLAYGEEDGIIEMSWGRGLGIGLLPEKTELETAYPNPFNSTTLLRVSVADPGVGSVVVYNSLGQRVHSIDMGYVGVGRYEIPLKLDRLAAGTYFVEFRIAGQRSLKRITYTK